MADLFTRRLWADGELLDAVEMNRVEAGVDSLDTELDVQTDRIDALYAGGGSSSRQFQSGPSASRPSPAIGLPYWDTDLNKLIIGTGTSWALPDGTPVSGTGGGGTTSPRNMRVTVTEGGTIGAIVLEWDADGDFCTLYETESPNGVSGATALTTNTTTRTPSTARNYEYWVTQTVGGVESAASNRVQATLPYNPGGGPPPGSSSDPSTFLNINGKGTGQGGWWNLGIGFEDGHTDITPSQLQNNYVNNPYYVMNSAGTAAQFQVFMNGGRTSSSTKYPRSELREYQTGSTSTKASWSGTSGRHVMRYKFKLLHLAPEKCEVVIGQMHDGSDDTLQIRMEAGSATGPYTLRLSINGSEVDDLKSGIALGQEVAVDIDVNNGALTVKVDGTTQYTGEPDWGSGQYFKLGCYVQQNSTDQDNPSSEYGRVEIRDLFVSHS